jgi:hypothetical protein
MERVIERCAGLDVHKKVGSTGVFLSKATAFFARRMREVRVHRRGEGRLPGAEAKLSELKELLQKEGFWLPFGRGSRRLAANLQIL